MAIWYMVKRLDTGEVFGHNTWNYSPVSSLMVDIGKVLIQRHANGSPHHYEVYVDAKDDQDAMLMAEVAFDLLTQDSEAS